MSKKSMYLPSIQKTFASYEDYLKSDKWKQVKQDFATYARIGWTNVCEVTGEIFCE